MKVYLFNTQSGLFEGEAFENPEVLQYKEGVTTVPPPEYEHGQVPIFDRSRNEWALFPLAIARQLLKGAAPEQPETRSCPPMNGCR